MKTKLTRFFIPVADWTAEGLKAALAKNAFKEIETSAEASSAGFVLYDDLLGTDFVNARENDILPGRHHVLRFGIRLDQRKPGAMLIKKFYQQLLAEHKQSWEKTVPAQGALVGGVQDKPIQEYKISKARKKEIKEQAKLKAMAVTPPTPSMANVVWDLKTGIVYLFSTQATFKRITPALLQRLVNQPVIELDAPTLMQAMGYDLPAEPVAMEFLTDCWKLATGGKKDDEPMSFRGGEAMLDVIGSVRLEQRKDGNVEKLAAGTKGDLGDLAEIRLALEDGRKIVAETMELTDGDGRVFEVGVNGSSFGLGLKLPKVERTKDDDPDAIFYDEIGNVGQATDFFDELFGRFLAEKYEQAKWAQGQDLEQVFEGDIARAYSIMQAFEGEDLTAGLNVVAAMPDWAAPEDESESIPMADLPATEDEPEAEMVQ